MRDRTAEFRSFATGAEPTDVASPQAAVLALYELISGPPGRERDWTRLRALFDPEARFLIGGWGPEPSVRRSAVYEWDLDAFVQEGREYWLEHGFWERQLHARTERFGHIAHVFSSYESRVGTEDSEPIGRGVNAVQLLEHGGRWWIVNVIWDVESADERLPEDLRGRP